MSRRFGEGAAAGPIEGAQARSYDSGAGDLRCTIEAMAALTIMVQAGARSRTRTAGGYVIVELSWMELRTMTPRPFSPILPWWRHAAGALALLLAAALLASLGLSAGTLFELKGLQLGETRAAVLRAHPDLRLRTVPYEDPLIGTDYALTFGRVATLRYEGDKVVRSDKAAYDLAVRLTGDDRLYSVVALVSDPALTCRQAVRNGAQRFGAPRIDESPGYALWGAPSMLGPQLEFHCLGDGLYRLELSDQALARAYEDRLATDLRDAVHELLQAARMPTAPSPELPPQILRQRRP